MTALVIGYGSAGQRHTRVLESLERDVAIVSQRSADGGRKVYGDLPAALAQASFDYVVIANETARHYASLRELAHLVFKGKVLVEKPLFAEPASLPTHGFAVAGVGYNLRFHPAIRALRKALSGGDAHMADFYVGQGLDTWRKGRDVKATYSASRAAGGGVLRDLSHELDLATWLFGPWRRVAALGGRLGSQTVDSDDGWGILLECERCPVVTIHLNYFDRLPRRMIGVQYGDSTFRADLIANSFQVDGKVEAFTLEPDSTYAAMHRALLTGSADICTLDQGLATADLVAAIESAGANRRWTDADGA